MKKKFIVFEDLNKIIMNLNDWGDKMFKEKNDFLVCYEMIYLLVV